MNWYRSWPAEVPPGRAYVQDNLPRLVMSDFDYKTVEGGMPKDRPGFFLLEWDIALGREGRQRFERIAMETPDRITVAPYWLDEPRSGARVLAHRRQNERGGWDFVLPGDQAVVSREELWVDLFGFGCIYFPQDAVSQWMETHRMMRTRFNDTSFSLWYHAQYGPARLTWAVEPQHLHGD